MSKIFLIILFFVFIPICYLCIIVLFLFFVPKYPKERKSAFIDYYIIAWSLFYLSLSTWFSMLTKDHRIYPYTIPFLASILLVLLLTFLNRYYHGWLLIEISRSIALLIIPIFFALMMHSWPGGDDAGLLFVGFISPGVIVNIILSIRSFILVRKSP